MDNNSVNVKVGGEFGLSVSSTNQEWPPKLVDIDLIKTYPLICTQEQLNEK